MTKGSKEALTVLIVTHVSHVERVKRLHYVHNIDTFNAMSKGSKDYVMLKKRTYTFLLITFLIFKRFSIRKKFWKAETPMQCILKHVEGVKSQNNFRPLRHTWHWIWLERSKSQLSKTFFGLKIHYIHALL